jgi:hypothetical protein
MLVSSVPYKFTVPWANSASGSFITNPVPAVSTSPAAGQDLGFPPATALPEGSGGTPPNINDINGALYYATAWEQWIQAGAPIVYDATFQTAIGGYPKGAIVPSAATPYLRWISTVDNNTSDPDTGGANWLAMSGRLTKITPFAASATYTPIVNLAFVIFKAVGSGGSGAGAAATGSNVSFGEPGSAGTYGEIRIPAASIGSSRAVVIGAAVAGGVNAAGGNGNSTTVGSTLAVFPGGIGGSQFLNQTAPAVQGNAGISATATSTVSGAVLLSRRGKQGAPCVAVSTIAGYGGIGGSTPMGEGGSSATFNTNGLDASDYGGGGGGVTVSDAISSANGGASGIGYLVAYEYAY